MKYLERLVICLALVGFLAVNSQAQSVPTRPACLEKSGDMLAGNPKNGINRRRRHLRLEGRRQHLR